MREHSQQQQPARPALYQEITDKIVAQIEAGILPWVQPWAGGPALSMPVNATTHRGYSGINILLLWDALFQRGYSHARNWRIMAFCMAGVSLIFAAGFVYEATRTKIAAYYVPISEIGRPGKVVLAGGTYTPTNAAITYFLSDWVRTAFSKSLDPIVLRENMVRSFAVLRGKAFTTMTEWVNQIDPMKDVGHTARTVTVDAILQRTDTTWEVDWSETTFTDGARSGTVRYTGLFSVDATPPSNQAELLANPLGLHLNSITWSREGASP